MIKEINDRKYCIECDKLLTLLIQDERKYDNNIDSNFKVSNYYYQMINNNKNTFLLGYFINEKLVGYIFTKYKLVEGDTNYTGYIDALYVLKDYRNKGIATSLLKETINILNKKNIYTIDINVLYNNKVALNLYKSLGFKEFKISLRKEISP